MMAVMTGDLLTPRKHGQGVYGRLAALKGGTTLQPAVTDDPMSVTRTGNIPPLFDYPLALKQPVLLPAA